MKPLLTPKLDFVFKLLFTQDAEILADLKIALRPGRYFGQNPRYRLNLQSRYDIDIAYDMLYGQIARGVRPMTDAANCI